eukprot:11820234-Ditylum_brightwellii.AAC.1
MVPRNDEIKPRNKFAALLAVIQQQYTNTTLKQWDADNTNQVQSIISGLHLPHEWEILAIFCPHVQRNMQLETQWRLKSTTRYYELKTNKTILEYLQRHMIFMNPSEIKQTEAIMAGYFVFLHVKFHSQKDAAGETKSCAHIGGFDLHVHTCHHV